MRVAAGSGREQAERGGVKAKCEREATARGGGGVGAAGSGHLPGGVPLDPGSDAALVLGAGAVGRALDVKAALAHCLCAECLLLACGGAVSGAVGMVSGAASGTCRGRVAGVSGMSWAFGEGEGERERESERERGGERERERERVSERERDRGRERETEGERERE